MAGGTEFVVRLRNTRKSLSAVGVHVDHSDGKTLLIQWIRPDGIFGTWNAGNPGRQVLVGDRVVGVNGLRGDAAAMMSALSKQEVLDVVVLEGDQHNTSQGQPAEPQPQAREPARSAPVPAAPSAPAQAAPSAPAWAPSAPASVPSAPGGKKAQQPTAVSARLHNPGRSLDSLGLAVDRCAEGGLLITRLLPGSVVEAWNREQQPAARLGPGDRIVAVNGLAGGFTALVREIERQEFLDLSVHHDPAAATEPRATERPAGPAPDAPRPAARQAASIGSDGAAGEGDEDGGARWFRVVFRPHVPARFIILRPKVPGRCQFCQGELVEASEVRGGWAKLAAAELGRRCLPDDVELWLLVDGTALGFSRFLSLAPEPVHYSRDGGVIIAESLDEVHSPWDPARVVLENDQAWALLQERLSFFSS